VQVSKIPIGQLNPAAYNPRKDLKPGDPEYKKLKRSIQEFGYVEPIVWNKRTGNIVGGHQRYKILIDMGMREVDCVVVDLDATKEKALNLALNKIQGDWDYEKLKDLLQELDTGEFDIELTGFDMDEIEDLIAQIHVPEEIIEDEVPEPPEEPITKPGDLWILGRHRLLCGDATKKEDVERLMDGKKADMVFTDPPYRMEAQGGSNQWVGRQVAKLGESIKELCDFDPTEFLNRLKELFENNMNAYVFCNKDLVPDYLNWGIENNYSFNILFWKKPNALPLGGQHRPDTEYLLFFRKNAIWNNGLENVSYSKCLEFSRDHSTDHPTMKPLGLIGNELKISSNENSLIVDLFGGSGSTLIACEQLNRTCYMMEIDPVYCDVIVKRWENLTGQKAVLAE